MLTDGSWGKYEGQWTSRLQSDLAAYLGRQHVHLCCSGTIATEIALHGLGVRPGQFVALAGYDFPGNFRAIESVGCIPVLVDVLPDGWVMSPESLDAALKEDVVAIVVSHLHGQLADMPKIMEIASAKDIPVIEDCCQVPGALIGGWRVGTFGDVATFSFGGSKLLTGGRGGASVTDDEAVSQRMRVFTDRGNDAFPLSQLQAACVVCMLEELDVLNQKRGAAVEFVFDQLRESALPVGVPAKDSIQSSAWYKVPFLMSDHLLEQSPRSSWMERFQSAGIPLDEGFRGFHLRSTRRCKKPVDLSNSKPAAERTLLLHHPAMLMDRVGLEVMTAAIIQAVTI